MITKVHELLAFDLHRFCGYRIRYYPPETPLFFEPGYHLQGLLCEGGASFWNEIQHFGDEKEAQRTLDEILLILEGTSEFL